MSVRDSVTCSDGTVYELHGTSYGRGDQARFSFWIQQRVAEDPNVSRTLSGTHSRNRTAVAREMTTRAARHEENLSRT